MLFSGCLKSATHALEYRTCWLAVRMTCALTRRCSCIWLYQDRRQRRVTASVEWVYVLLIQMVPSAQSKIYSITSVTALRVARSTSLLKFGLIIATKIWIFMHSLQAVSVAQSIGARDYVECCAKTRWNVKEVFKSAADAILHKDDKEDGKSPEETNKSQSVLRRFSWFTRRSSSGSADLSDCNTVARSVSSSRRLSLFTTSWHLVELRPP